MRPVLILKLCHGALAVARTLGRMGVPITAIHTDISVPAAGSRYLQEVHEWDFDGHGDQETLERVLEVGCSMDQPILIPTDDTAGGIVDEHADALHEVFTFPHQPKGLVPALYSKRGLHGLCLEHDVPTPLSGFPENRDDAAAIIAKARFPLLIKPIDTARFNRRNGIRMLVAKDAEDALAAYDRYEDPEDPNVMLQEFIPGTSADVWVFTGYFDAGSERLFGAGGRKLRQYPIHTGTTCYGVLESNAQMEAATARFVKALGYRGVWDCGYRYDHRDGRYKLLDVNPRVGQNFRQCVGRGGLDVVRAMYCDLTGQQLPRDTPHEGRIWWVENYDLLAAIAWMRQGELTPRSWGASLQRVDEPAWFARDDPAPFGRMLAAAGKLAARRLTPMVSGTEALRRRRARVDNL